jgi:RNA polymerase sigma-70 factor (ECF subfamily)
MAVPGADPSIDKLFGSRIAAVPSHGGSALEDEVAELFDAFRGPLLRYLSAVGLSSYDGEEVIQEIFLSLFLHLRDGKPRSNIRGWIFRVAHNLGLKRREANHRTLKLVVHLAERAGEFEPDAGPDPEQHVSTLQRRERLLAIVQALPEQDRRCLYLRAEGLRYREIAQVLDISLGSVALSLARSLRRLAGVDYPS